MSGPRVSADFMRNQLPAIGWAVVIFVGSSIPGKDIPDLGFKPQDKIAHIIEFGILGFLLLRAYRSTSYVIFHKYAVIWAGIFGIAWGILDEAHQLLVPGRCASTYDVTADAIGVLAGLAAFLWLERRDRLFVQGAQKAFKKVFGRMDAQNKP